MYSHTVGRKMSVDLRDVVRSIEETFIPTRRT
jgi:hypothetical protein